MPGNFAAVCCNENARSMSTIRGRQTKQSDALASRVGLVRTDDRHFVAGRDAFSKIATGLSMDG